MQYQVKNAPLPVLICKLNPGESIECQKGAMAWMTPTMEMKTNFGGNGESGVLGALGKVARSAVTGESIFSEIHIPPKAEAVKLPLHPLSPEISCALTFPQHPL